MACQLALGQAARDAGAEARSAALEALIDGAERGAIPGNLRIINDRDGYVRAIAAPPSSHFPVTAGNGVSPADKARAFLRQYRALFMDDSATVDFLATRTKTREKHRYVRLQQTYAGIPVFGAELTVQLDDANEVVYAFADIKRRTDDLGGGGIALSPTLSAADAQSRALELAWPVPAGQRGEDQAEKGEPEHQVRGWLLGRDRAIPLEAGPATLMIYAPEVVGSGGPARLVWQMVLNAVDDPAVAESVLVDAHSGEIAFHYPLVYTALNRQIYDANNTANDPGTLVRSEGGAPVGLVDANNAYDYFGHTYAFYSSEHGRDSINNAGMTLSGTVRYCPEAPCPYANAFWSDSTNRMYFGEGYASADDVVAHELTHGVTSYESNLIYFNQSGAINESFSDMWGEWVDQTNGAGNDAPGVKWYMGEDLPIGAIRNMANPPEFGDPDRMGSPYYSANIADLGAVHWNSGVGNKLCYLLTDGDTFNGRTVTAMGIGSTADLFYECQANLLTSASDYMDLYVLLLQAANTFGYTQMQTNNLVEACLAVELGVQPDKLAVGDYAGYWGFPMYTAYHDSRTQSIYLASEIGRSGRITAVSLYVTTVPGQPLNNWTIRMKTTALSAFPAPASMDGTGWTVCYQANETVSSTGQRTFTFSTPFQYDGASNLMIDFSHNNTSYTTAGSCLAFVPGGYRSVYAYSDSTNGDPLTWSGTSSPSKTRSTAVPCVALTFSAASATVTNVSSVHANGSFTVGEVIDIDVTFAVPVSVTGTPRLELETGNINRMATYLSGSGGATLTFRYTVASGDTSPDLDYTNGGALRFNGGTIKDVSTQTLAVLTLPAPGASGSLGANRAIVIDTAAPTVSSVTSSLANGTYPVGQVVPVQVTFDEAVVYMAGTGVAQLQLETGVTDRQAPYAGGTGTAGLTFNYTVQPGDMSPDLEYFSTGALTLTGTATIKDVAGNNAVLALPGLGTPASLGGSKDIVIDTTGPPGTVDAAASPQPDRDLPNWNDTEAEKMSVLKFRVSDQGVDGWPTLIDRITVSVSGTAGNAANDIAWAELRDASVRVALAASISNTQIIFGAPPNSDSVAQLTTVADNAFVEYTVYIYLNTVLIGQHDETYVFAIDEDGVGTDAGNSSPMGLNSGAVTPVTGTLVIPALGITVTPDVWNIGASPLSHVVTAGPFTVQNTSTVAGDISIKGGNGSNGWTLENAVGLNAFKVEADKGFNDSYETTLSTGEQSFAVNVPVSGAETLGLRYRGPSGDSFGAGLPQDFTITLKVSAYAP